MDSKKSDLRKKLRADRHHHAPESEWNYLREAPEFQSALVIASYASYGNEPDTREINALILEKKKTLLLPKLNPDRTLTWIAWNGNKALLSRNHNHDEPIGVPYSGDIDLIITPALAVDSRGHRLGQGGGSYDRALATMSAWKVALLNDDELLSEDLPQEDHDQSVDAVVTPKRIVRFR